MAANYITELSTNVERRHVRYNNRYGIAIAADIYQAKNLDTDQKHPALIVGAPYGGTKEQGPAVYANQLAQQGFVVLTFDQVYMGESGGEPRHVSSPDLFAESFSTVVDYLGVKVPYVDRNKIGVVGICGSAGFALSAAAVDTRIKAVVTTSMYDITNVRGMMNLSKEQINDMKNQLVEQRWVDFENGDPQYIPSFPETPYPSVDELLETDLITNEWQRFYAVPRGFHPNARGNFTTTSSLAMLQFDALRYVDEISPRPILFIYGDKAHSRSFSEVAYDKAAEPKEKYIVEDCEHIDLYDKVDKIPFDKITSFMNENLK
ncbi:alpha/beta hydrolase [Lentilactobacillus senioris]|uniref:alpha/beta hydrolase n=1 Tax=Lentilactobacillus senioris TaxID=931534 RepID=UPI00227E96FA|nr:alpha/beta hydrolase [Lentilactobacillus senioris]MCY9806716.1 alpha/beta hydrolase [Lentilactobacillus senioris]